MSKNKVLLYIGLIVLFLLGWGFRLPNQEKTDISERAKIALRNVGNELLLTNKDSTSLVLPVKEVNDFQYKLSFQNHLFFEPNQLVEFVKNSFRKTSLPQYYRVEVVRCIDNEVAYSYEIKNEETNNIIPCRGRELPLNCYIIQVKFTKIKNTLVYNYLFLIALFVTIIFFIIDYLQLKPDKKKQTVLKVDVLKVGDFEFYPTQHKLRKKAREINLSKKECELLMIFVEHKNKIVTREELTKRVWEDNGVFVGRSLDTYVSKLRKKLSEDIAIKITNVHGVGYRLEINK